MICSNKKPQRDKHLAAVGMWETRLEKVFSGNEFEGWGTITSRGTDGLSAIRRW